MILSILKKYIWIVNIILLIAIAYVLSLLINQKVATKIFSSEQLTSPSKKNSTLKIMGNTNKTRRRSYYDLIYYRNLFGVTYDNEFSSSTNSSTTDDSAPETTLNLELLGTYISTAGISIAVIKNLDTGKIDGYTDGDKLGIVESESIKLLGVENCKVLIDRNAKGTETIVCKKEIKATRVPVRKASFETVRSDSKKRRSKKDEKSEKNEGIVEVEDGVYEVEKNLLNDLLDDPTSLVNQARVVPQKDGLRFFGIRPSSVFFKIGIRNGDTLHRINNVELNDVQNALGIFGSLKNESEFRIDFTRRGKKFTYEYSVN